MNVALDWTTLILLTGTNRSPPSFFHIFCDLLSLLVSTPRLRSYLIRSYIDLLCDEEVGNKKAPNWESSIFEVISCAIIYVINAKSIVFSAVMGTWLSSTMV